ncbi:MAG: hypothetical protein ACI3T9_03890 [Romboutsia timonensis]
MLEINKKEFFENFNQGDIIGLDNLEKQLRSILAEVHDNMKANVENEKIVNTGVADILCEMETDTTKKLTLLDYVKSLNYIFVETETTKSLNDYYDLAEQLYKKALNDLFSLVNIEDKDFEIYQG